MDRLNDIDQTAAALFIVRIVNGEVPDQIRGGEHDGLEYFVADMDEVYWLTEYG